MYVYIIDRALLYVIVLVHEVSLCFFCGIFFLLIESARVNMMIFFLLFY